MTATHHKKIHTANNGVIRPDFEENLSRVRIAALSRDEHAIREAIFALVPTFRMKDTEGQGARTPLVV